MSESTEDWCRRIGSKKAMEERQAERMAGELNAPIKGAHGLAQIVGKMTGALKKPHSLACQCETCIPEEIKPWIVEMKKWDLTISPGKPKPHTIIPPSTLSSQPKGKGFPVPVKRWQQRGSSGN